MMVISENQAQLLEYLKQVSNLQKQVHRPGWRYHCYEALLLDVGRIMSPMERPENLPQGRPKSCFYNAQSFIKLRSGFTYVEGYAVSAVTGIPIPHAWLRCGECAVEVTWSQPGVAYLGVPLHTEWLSSFIHERQKRSKKDDLSVLQGNYIEDFSLLVQGFPLEALA